MFSTRAAIALVSAWCVIRYRITGLVSIAALGMGSPQVSSLQFSTSRLIHAADCISNLEQRTSAVSLP